MRGDGHLMPVLLRAFLPLRWIHRDRLRCRPRRNNDESGAAGGDCAGVGSRGGHGVAVMAPHPRPGARRLRDLAPLCSGVVGMGWTLIPL
jgi:hypothetical protein